MPPTSDGLVSLASLAHPQPVIHGLLRNGYQASLPFLSDTVERSLNHMLFNVDETAPIVDASIHDGERFALVAGKQAREARLKKDD